MSARIYEREALRDEEGSREGVPGSTAQSGSGQGDPGNTAESTTTSSTDNDDAGSGSGSGEGVTSNTSQLTITSKTSSTNNDEGGSGDNVLLINDENARSGSLPLVWEIVSSEEEELSGV